MISIRTLSRNEDPQLEEDKLLGTGIPEGLNVESPPQYRNAYQPIPRLGSLYLRFGLAENASHHLSFPGQRPEQSELQKLKSLEKHLKQCSDARKLGDWKNVLRESDAAIEMGVESSPQEQTFADMG